tara:strand:+ start:810 stop:1283 length:474 start_codon:yes stop_codon:yes gene_type:complete
MLKKNIFNLLLVIFIFILDRLSKIIIIKLSEPLGELNISITSFINFNLIWNEGIAFGLLSFDDKFYYNLITLLIVLITLIIIWLINKAKGIEKLSFLMIVGGSLGNIFDRIYYSSVPDFIDISVNNFHWFIFNVADIFISIGVILLIILEFFKKKIS